jgi:hypothetical protein
VQYMLGKKGEHSLLSCQGVEPMLLGVMTHCDDENNRARSPSAVGGGWESSSSSSTNPAALLKAASCFLLQVQGHRHKPM